MTTVDQVAPLEPAIAAPPVGALRWHEPMPVKPWTGVRDALAFGAPCAQAAMGWNDNVAAKSQEDCLYLNVWTPACDDARRPVMVWIHGGAFVLGAGSHGVYDGTELAERGVVVVTINYRLGAFGFLALELTSSEAPCSGAEGIADQILALD